MKWWDGLWLNEGFAAWMEHFCVDALYPEYHIWEQFTTDAFGAAQRLDSLKTSHPIIVPIKHAEEVEQVRATHCEHTAFPNLFVDGEWVFIYKCTYLLYVCYVPWSRQPSARPCSAR